jgi:hypothetical protein
MDDRIKQVSDQGLDLIAEAHRYVESDYVTRWETALDRLCKSPIERYLALSYLCLLKSKSIGSNTDFVGYGYGHAFLYDTAVAVYEGTPTLEALLDPTQLYARFGGGLMQIDGVYPQYQLGRFRADLLVVRLAYAVDNPAEEKCELFKVAGPVVVECDGFAFHDRTKEQAVRDKQRERAIVDLGYPVLRFAGSELYRDPLKCARELDAYMASHKRVVARVLDLGPSQSKEEGAEGG